MRPKSGVRGSKSQPPLRILPSGQNPQSSRVLPLRDSSPPSLDTPGIYRSKQEKDCITRNPNIKVEKISGDPPPHPPWRAELREPSPEARKCDAAGSTATTRPKGGEQDHKQQTSDGTVRYPPPKPHPTDPQTCSLCFWEASLARLLAGFASLPTRRAGPEGQTHSQPRPPPAPEGSGRTGLPARTSPRNRPRERKRSPTPRECPSTSGHFTCSGTGVRWQHTYVAVAAQVQ